MSETEKGMTLNGVFYTDKVIAGFGPMARQMLERAKSAEARYDLLVIDSNKRLDEAQVARSRAEQELAQLRANQPTMPREEMVKVVAAYFVRTDRPFLADYIRGGPIRTGYSRIAQETIDALSGHVADQSAEIETLRAKLEAAQADARRYKVNGIALLTEQEQLQSRLQRQIAHIKCQGAVIQKRNRQILELEQRLRDAEPTSWEQAAVVAALQSKLAAETTEPSRTQIAAGAFAAHVQMWDAARRGDWDAADGYWRHVRHFLDPDGSLAEKYEPPRTQDDFSEAGKTAETSPKVHGCNAGAALIDTIQNPAREALAHAMPPDHPYPRVTELDGQLSDVTTTFQRQGQGLQRHTVDEIKSALLKADMERDEARKQLAVETATRIDAQGERDREQARADDAERQLAAVTEERDRLKAEAIRRLLEYELSYDLRPAITDADVDRAIEEARGTRKDE